MSKKTKETIEPEWPHKVEADTISEKAVRLSISASPQERKDVARRIGIESIEKLAADMELARDPGNMFIHVQGTLKADITQNCVVTLEPLQASVEEEFEAWFGDADAVVPLAKARHELMGRKTDSELPILEEHEDPEPIIDGHIDVGELVTQYFSLAVDPYPHQEGVTHDQLEDAKKAGETVPSTRKNPFAVLKTLKEPKEAE